MSNQIVLSRTLLNIEIPQRQSDGYLPATKICDAIGKQWNNYYRNKKTQSYISVLSAETRIRASELIQIVKGGIPENQGTWIHPKVAIHFAQWLSPEFAVQVTNWVYDWMLSGVSPTPTKQIEYIPLSAESQLRIRAAIADRQKITPISSGKLLFQIRNTFNLPNSWLQLDDRKTDDAVLLVKTVVLEGEYIAANQPQLPTKPDYDAMQFIAISHLIESTKFVIDNFASKAQIELNKKIQWELMRGTKQEQSPMPIL